MASIKKLQPGMTVYNTQRVKMGNTTRSYNALYELKIIEVNIEENWVIASWNGNPKQKYKERDFKKWKIKKPEPKKQVWGFNSY